MSDYRYQITQNSYSYWLAATALHIPTAACRVKVWVVCVYVYAERNPDRGSDATVSVL